MSINLLQDRETVENNGKKKKTSPDFDLTDPKSLEKKPKNLEEKRGLLEFFKELLSRAPKVKIQSQKEIEKKAELVGKKRPRSRKETEKEGLATPPSLEEPGERDHTSRLPSRPAPREEIIPPVPPLQSKPTPKQPEHRLEPPRSKKAEKRVLGRRERKEHQARKKDFEETEPDIATPSDEPVLDVNLIPEEIRAKLEPKRKIKIFIVSVVVCSLTISIVGGGMIWYQNSIEQKIEDVRAETQLVEAEIAKLGTVQKTGEELSRKITLAQGVLNSHIHWTQFLAEVETYTLPDVYYKNLAANVAGTVTLTATAKDLQTLASQYVVFQNAEDFVESVEVNSVAIGTEEENQAENVSFTLTLSVNPEIFYNDPEASDK